MELNYLREFVTLAQTCNYHEAADLLYITQPTLSKHIKVLEQELGRELFLRTSRKVVLTEFGRSYLPYATRIVEIDRECDRKLFTKTEADVPPFCIGVSPSVSPASLLSFFPMFSKAAPGTKINLIEQEDDVLAKMMRADECSMLLSREYQELSEPSFEQVPFNVDTLVAVLPLDSPLAGRDNIDLKELSGIPYIHLGRQSTHNACLGAPVIIVSHGSMAVNLVGQGFGVSIVPKNVAINYKSDKVALVDLVPSPCVQINLVYAKKNAELPIIRVIVDYLRSRGNGSNR